MHDVAGHLMMRRMLVRRLGGGGHVHRAVGSRQRLGKHPDNDNQHVQKLLQPTPLELKRQAIAHSYGVN